MRTNYERDQETVREMWTHARNEPMTLKELVPFGFINRDNYRRTVRGVTIEFTLEADPQTRLWSYELALIDPDGGIVDPEVVQYWLGLFFGNQAGRAARRSMLFPAEARFTFPYT